MNSPSVPCPLGLSVSETPKRHNASTGSSLSLLGLHVLRFCESGLPSSRLLASRVPGTRNAEMMTHDNMPPIFHDSWNHEVSVLPSVFCLSKSRFTKCRNCPNAKISKCPWRSINDSQIPMIDDSLELTSRFHDSGF
jgi:hypothetical protein